MQPQRRLGLARYAHSLLDSLHQSDSM